MDIQQVRFGNYSIGNPKGNVGAKQKQANEKTQANNNNETPKTVDADKFFEALNMQGVQNKMQVSVTKTEVNPLEHLSQERINDIEAMMAEFENGVEQTANLIEGEFPGLFANDKKYALAAQVFAKE